MQGYCFKRQEKCDNDIRKCTGNEKDVHQKLSKVLRNKHISLEAQKRVLNYYVISIVLYDRECQTDSSQMKTRGNRYFSTERYRQYHRLGK